MTSIEALLGLFFLAGNHFSYTPADANGNRVPAKVENRPDSVIIKATSNGCTKKRHFRIITDKNENLQVIRIRPDRCQQAPRQVVFRYSHKQMGVEQPKALDGTRFAGN
jgi:hypothetical protein